MFTSVQSIHEAEGDEIDENVGDEYERRIQLVQNLVSIEESN